MASCASCPATCHAAASSMAHCGPVSHESFVLRRAYPALACTLENSTYPALCACTQHWDTGNLPRCTTCTVHRAPAPAHAHTHNFIFLTNFNFCVCSLPARPFLFACLHKAAVTCLVDHATDWQGVLARGLRHDAACGCRTDGAVLCRSPCPSLC